MAEGGPNSVQCTDPADQTGDDVLTGVAGQLNHKVLLEEVYHFYEDAIELVQKNKVKEEYIEELNQKIQELQHEVQDKEVQMSALRSRLARMEVDAGRQTVVYSDQTMDLASGGCGRMESINDRTNRDLIQGMLLKISNLENENKELREMYGMKVKENDRHEHLARRCLQQEKEINQLRDIQQQLAKKEEECQTNQRQVLDLQRQLRGLKDEAESLKKTSYAGFPDAPLALTLDDASGQQDNSSIHLRELTSPPLKRGRFTMKKSYPYECSKCSAFFSSKEEAAKTACCYHTKTPVSAILRHGSGNIDPVNPDVFWPCCKRIGRQAVKCARGGTHKFNQDDGGKNPER